VVDAVGEEDIVPIFEKSFSPSCLGAKTIDNLAKILTLACGIIDVGRITGRLEVCVR
jgi:hypothetical protein